MSIKAPDFASSSYLEITDNGWFLKEGAPQEVVDEFNEYMDKYEKSIRKGAIL